MVKTMQDSGKAKNMNISKTVTKPLKKLFSPSALAATVATGMLIQVAVASGGGQNCLSQCTTTVQTDCTPNMSCSVDQSFFWCCPFGDQCGQIYMNAGCPSKYAAWCVCPN